MATYLIRNTLNPSKVVKCSVAIRKLTHKGVSGEPSWVIQLGVDAVDLSGDPISPVFLNLVSLDNLDEEIKKATELISSQIDWLPTFPDGRSPFVSFSSPTQTDIMDVSIDSDVVLDIEEALPAAGIDPDSITIEVNGMDETHNLTIIGDPFKYRVVWKPFMRVHATY